MTFSLAGNGGNCVPCQWVQGEGVIEDQTANDFRAFVAKQNQEFGGNLHATIFLNSPGGTLIGGLTLGEAIRELGFDTGIGRTIPDEVTDSKFEKLIAGDCLSACSFAFLGGLEREVGDGQIGVHQFYDANAIANPDQKVFSAIDVSTQQLLEGLVLDYVTRMGVDAGFVTLASRTPPTDMHILSEEERTNLRVTWDPNGYLPWRIEPYKDGIVAFTKSQDGRKTLTLYCDRNRDRRALFHEEKGPDATEESYMAAQISNFKYLKSITVLGEEVAMQRVSPSQDQSGYSIAFDLGTHFALPSASNDFGISSFDGPMVASFSLGLNPEGATANVGAAFKNCLS